MLLTRLLNACHHFPGFVYEGARLNETTQTIEVAVRPRRGSRPRCSGCGQVAPGYDTQPERLFEFIPIWGFAVVLLYRMRRVHCSTVRGQVLHQAGAEKQTEERQTDHAQDRVGNRSSGSASDNVHG
jgi:transposase